MTAHNPSQDPTQTGFQQFSPEMSRREIFEAAAGLDSDQRIQFWRTFQSTVDMTCPSMATCSLIDDVAAVTAGSKPATILTAEDFMDPTIDEFMAQQHARIKGLFRSEAVDYYGGAKYFIGQEENVGILADLYEGRGGSDSPLPSDESFHRSVGEALGYPAEAIDAFVAQTASFEQRGRSKSRTSALLGALGLRH